MDLQTSSSSSSRPRRKSQVFNTIATVFANYSSGSAGDSPARSSAAAPRRGEEEDVDGGEGPEEEGEEELRAPALRVTPGAASPGTAKMPSVSAGSDVALLAASLAAREREISELRAQLERLEATVASQMRADRPSVPAPAPALTVESTVSCSPALAIPAVEVRRAPAAVVAQGNAGAAAELALLRAENAAAAAAATAAELLSLRSENAALRAKSTVAPPPDAASANAEAQLAALRSENAALLAAMAALERDVATARGQCSELQRENDELHCAVTAASGRVEDSARLLEQMEETDGAQVGALQRECQDLRVAREALLARVRAAEQRDRDDQHDSRSVADRLQARVKVLEAASHVAESQTRQLTAHAASQAAALEQYEAALREAEGQGKGLREASARAALLAAQTAHLQHDNGRLVVLLRSTAEYRAFALRGFPAVGSEHGGTFHRSSYFGALPMAGTEEAASFLGGKLSRAADVAVEWAPWDEVPRLEAQYNQGTRRRYVYGEAPDDFGGNVADGAALDALLEAQHWMPADAAALCTRFRRAFVVDVPPQSAAAFLLGLNVIWQARLDTIVESETASLRKQLAEARYAVQRREPYKEVLQAATIAKLHSELDAIRQTGAGSGGTVGRAHAAIAIPRERSPSPVAFGRTSDRRPALADSFRSPRRSSPGHTAPAATATRDQLSAAMDHVTGGGTGAIAASLLSVPGSGGRRADAAASAGLLESALEAVDALHGRAERAERAAASLKAALRALGVSDVEVVSLTQEGATPSPPRGPNTPQQVAAPPPPAPDSRPHTPVLARRPVPQAPFSVLMSPIGMDPAPFHRSPLLATPPRTAGGGGTEAGPGTSPGLVTRVRSSSVASAVRAAMIGARAVVSHGT
jgi:hypothetical protein